MGEFRKFLEGYKGTGGAFGSGGGGFDFSKKSNADDMDMRRFSDREALKYQHIEKRVESGRQMEAKIISALREHGWEINPPKPGQDKNGKIDGWVNRGKKWVPIQVKYRDSGDEIAMETMYAWDESRFFDSPLIFDGRDMVGSAQLYACLNQAGTTIRVCSASEAKSAAQESCKKLANDFQKMGKRVSSTSKSESRITGDPASGRAKVMSFVKPGGLSSMELFNIPGNKSLWAA